MHVDVPSYGCRDVWCIGGIAQLNNLTIVHGTNIAFEATLWIKQTALYLQSPDH